MPTKRFGPPLRRMGGRWALLLAVAVWVCLRGPGASLARASGPVQVLVRDSEPAEFLERIQGQLRDVDVEIIVLRPPSAAPDAPAHLGNAQASVVVWFDVPRPDLDRLLVYVADAKQGHTLVRELGSDAPGPRGPGSATLEAGALVVREAVRIFVNRASFAGLPEVMDAPPPGSRPPPEVVADAREPAVLPTRAMPPIPEPTQPAGRASPSPPEPAQSSAPTSPPGPVSTRLGYKVGLGWDATMDRLAPAVHYGPILSAAISWSLLELGLAGQFGLPVEPHTEYGSLRFQRHVGCMWAGVAQEIGRAVSLGARLRLGGLGYHRSTPKGGAVSPSEARIIVSPFVGAEGRLGWLASRGVIWLGGVIGVDAMPRTVRFGYFVQGRYTPAVRPGHVQPRAALSMEYRLH